MFGFRRKTYLDADVEKQIVEAITEVERHTRAEIRVHLSGRIRKSVYEDAVFIFKKTGMHRTELRSGVMIYVVPEKKQFAIIGDIGIHEKVTEQFWNSVRDIMQQHFASGDMARGIISGIEMAGARLAEYFPASGHNPNEISNEISRN